MNRVSNRRAITIALLCTAVMPSGIAYGTRYDFSAGVGADRFAYGNTVQAAARLPAISAIPVITLTQADGSARRVPPDKQRERIRSNTPSVVGGRRAPGCSGSSIVPALVTVQTAGVGGQFQHFVVRVTNQPLLDQMIDICNGLSPQLIVTGDMATGNGGYNQDVDNALIWSWHIVEDSIALAQNTIELCDGLPTHVEGSLQYWVETVTTFCPWSSAIVAVESDTALAGDFDIDGAVDQADFLFLQGCFTGFNNPCFSAGVGCCAPDMDADTDIDCTDGALFEQGWTAPGAPPVLSLCSLGVPTLSEWGVICMTLMMLVAGSILCAGFKRGLVS